MKALIIVCLIFMVSCGATPFKDGAIIEYNGIKFKVSPKANIGLFVWQYDYYEEVTMSDGTKKWIKTERDLE